MGGFEEKWRHGGSEVRLLEVTDHFPGLRFYSPFFLFTVFGFARYCQEAILDMFTAAVSFLLNFSFWILICFLYMVNR